MTKKPLADLVHQHGATGKLVRAICAQEGWRHTPNGAPAAWYEAWQRGLGAEVARALESECLA